VVPLLEPINKTVRPHQLFKLSRFIIRIAMVPGIIRFNRKKPEVYVGEKQSLLGKFNAELVGDYRFLGISECSFSLREFWSRRTPEKVLEPAAMLISACSEKHYKSLEDMHWASANPVVEMVKTLSMVAFHSTLKSNILSSREV
jgi:hypothetical protein